MARDWTKGSIIGSLLSLSWPLVINNTVHILGPVIPLIWVGRIGVSSIAALGVANSIAGILTVSGMMGLTIGTRAIIARYIGAGDSRGANHVARQAFATSAIYAVIATTIGLVFAEKFLAVFGLEAEVVAEGTLYLRIIASGSIVVCLRYMAEGIMQSTGDTMTPMKFAVIFRTVFAVLCPALVLGWGIFPRLGIAGAAISDIFSHGVGLILIMWAFFSGRTRLRLTLNDFRLDPDMMWRIVKIGIPASVMVVQRNFGHLVLIRFMVPFGTVAVAAHGIIQRIEMLLYAPSQGAGFAAGVLVGQNLGAQQPERARQSGWLAVRFVEVILIICSVIMAVFAEKIIAIFSPEPALVSTGAVFLRIAVCGYLVLGFEAVFQQCISGSGDTFPPMLISILTLWAIQVPLASLLPDIAGLGVYGVRWAMVAGIFTGAVAYSWYFRRGRWQQKIM